MAKSSIVSFTEFESESPAAFLEPEIKSSMFPMFDMIPMNRSSLNGVEVGGYSGAEVSIADSICGAHLLSKYSLY